ncbi:hypothetical protein BJ875DRAFT_269548 [Amylocarpus encephaloides]|uniref:Uncharacterized protein n=1 Tax=Amylocarpus encephaloides TaxID=45428 RepID=A0A9P8C6A0_9HELO|nr:hypothetical protein BJ875DRAFT_269548 [Amylocarpus encephaloides]
MGCTTPHGPRATCNGERFKAVSRWHSTFAHVNIHKYLENGSSTSVNDRQVTTPPGSSCPFSTESTASTARICLWPRREWQKPTGRNKPLQSLCSPPCPLCPRYPMVFLRSSNGLPMVSQWSRPIDFQLTSNGHPMTGGKGSITRETYDPFSTVRATSLHGCENPRRSSHRARSKRHVARLSNYHSRYHPIGNFGLDAVFLAPACRYAPVQSHNCSLCLSMRPPAKPQKETCSRERLEPVYLEAA